MKLFYFLALKASAARRDRIKDECDRAHLPDIEHGEWICKYNGAESDHSHPEECDLVCNGGFVHSDSGKPFARCHLNPRKQDETWFPNPKKISGYAQCIPDIAETCDSFPSYKDMKFFLLNNEQVTGHDGYSDDDLPELQAMFSGTIPIPALWKTNEFADAGPYNQWTMYIDFGASDSNLDISGVKFESVNAVVVGQTNRFLILRNREYNGDLSFAHLDIQGRSYDETQALTLANLKHSPVLLFREHYWNTQCIEDAVNMIPRPSEFTSFCEYLSIQRVNICNPLGPDEGPECLTAKDRYESICGTEHQEEEEGSGISGYEEGSGASGIILAEVEM